MGEISDRDFIQMPQVVPLPARAIRRSPKTTKEGALDTLTFYTWWREGTALGLKRFTTTIEFDLATCNFNISFEDKHDPVTVPQISTIKHGPVSPIDLFVGATLPLLGRKVTLMQASKATCRWLDVYAQQLGRLRNNLKTELAKFDSSLRRSDYTNIPIKKQGKTNLRGVVADINDIRKKLSNYRPKIVRKLLFPFKHLEPIAKLCL